MKKRISLIVIVSLLVSLCACAPLQSTETTAATGPKVVAPDSLELLAVEALDGEASGGIGYVIIYEDADRVIFNGEYGLFAYDLVQREMIFSVDYRKTHGTLGSIQGDTGIYAEASPDGMEIMFCYYENGAEQEYSDAYYIDVAAMTWRTGEFQELDEEFDRDLVEGEVNPGMTIKEARYERSGETWDVFAEYFE